MHMRLFKERNGYWYIEFRRGFSRSTTTKDDREALDVFKTLRREWLAGRIVQLEKLSKVTLDKFREEYVKYSKTNKGRETWIRDDYSLRCLKKHIGNLPLTSITQRKIEQWQSTMVMTGRKAVGTNITMRHLRSAFQKAIKWRYIAINPFDEIESLPESPKTTRCLKPDEIKIIFENIKDPDFKDLILIYLHQGLRRSSAVNLMAKHIDFENNEIYVAHAKGHLTYYVPMHPIVRDILERRMGEGRVGRIFPKWKVNSVTHKWERLMKKLGIEARLHDLRHSYASYLAMGGESLQTIMELMGLKQIQTVMRYSHLSKDYLQTAIRKLKLRGICMEPKNGKVVSIENHKQ